MADVTQNGARRTPEAGSVLEWPVRIPPARAEHGAASRLLPLLSPDVARVLERALGGLEISVDEADLLFATRGLDFQALLLAADELRAQTNGDVVTYVVNRNINFTNVCIKHCGFCAFSRDHRTEEGYFLPAW